MRGYICAAKMSNAAIEDMTTESDVVISPIEIEIVNPSAAMPTVTPVLVTL